MEQLSEHPLAKAIVRQAEIEGVETLPAESVTSLTGWGMEGIVAGKTWRIGKTDVLDRLDDRAEAERWKRQRSILGGEGKTVSVVMDGERVAGLVALQDVVRPQAIAAVASFRRSA